MVCFCGGSVVPRHCWELVHQCRKECYSTTPTFEKFLALLIILLILTGNVVLRRFWWLVHQCQKNAIQQCQLLMASTTVRKQRLFISANSWSLLALLKMVCFCGGSVVPRHCWELVHQCRKNAIQQCQFFMIFGHCLIFYFPASRLYLALVVVGTTVPNQKLFISANFWWFPSFFNNLLFFGEGIVL